jgi:type IV pilus assembly protein PilE
MRPPTTQPSLRTARGFTLIELLITLVVVTIIAGVALPSFMDSIRKSRRSEAFSAISAAQQAQERWRGNNAAYSTTLSDLGVTSPTSSGYYDVAVSAPSAPGTLANGYIVTATGRSGTSQANDTECKKVGVQVIGGNVTYGGCGGCGSLTFSNTHACWSR